jgi:hypothetical protein
MSNKGKTGQNEKGETNASRPFSHIEKCPPKSYRVHNPLYFNGSSLPAGRQGRSAAMGYLKNSNTIPVAISLFLS